ncbi:hypothetical protein J1N35_038272 [Gossypium stocksii]|uniref:DUF4283 domain-containing protein n=1 Tax=Gossypium stocksii TaxID=47602 RepID=A0A9D3ULF5_9ROSI|nr:hypothetical protein J1N35_038272 [Gossypium stocksii]
MVKADPRTVVLILIANICSQFKYMHSSCKVWIAKQKALENMHSGLISLLPFGDLGGWSLVETRFTMVKDIDAMLERLKFLEEESVQVISTNVVNNFQSFETWAVGKIMVEEKSNREVMYKVFKLLWFTKEEVNFVALKEDAIIVKFGCLEDRSRTFNLMPWLFDNFLFAMMPFIKGKDIDTYEFNLSPFWLRVYNIPLEYMDRQTALDVGNAIGKLVAID